MGEQKSSCEVTLILSYEEIRAITSRSRYGAQARALAQMGISYRLRPDGFPLVSRAHFEQIMGTDASSAPKHIVEPNWDALNAA